MRRIPNRNGVKWLLQRWGHGWGRGILLLVLCVPSCMGWAAEPNADTLLKKTLTATAATICAATYKAGDGLEASYLTDGGWEVKQFTLPKNGVTAHITVARHAGLLQGKPWTVLAFRGSASKADWKLNLKTGQVLFAPTSDKKVTKETKKNPDTVPQVHKGFWQYTQAVLDSAFDVDGDGQSDQMIAWLRQHPEEKILLTGHSLGGACATLYGEALVQAGIPKSQVQVITFGAPAVGNKAFAQQYGEHINLLRVYTTLDPVPGALQTLFSDYQQFGEKEEFPISGKQADYQHPVSYYLDLAVKGYDDALDAAAAAKQVELSPAQKVTGDAPLTALAVYTRDNGADRRITPNVGRFILEAYKSLLPRYIVLEEKQLPAGNAEFSSALREKARAAGADVLVVATVEKRRIGQTDQWSLQVVQELTGLTVNVPRPVTAGSTRVRWEQGFLQSALNLWQEPKENLGQVVPLQKGTDPLWNYTIKEAGAYENH